MEEHRRLLECAQGQPFLEDAVSDPKSVQWLFTPVKGNSSKNDGDNSSVSDNTPTARLVVTVIIHKPELEIQASSL